MKSRRGEPAASQDREGDGSVADLLGAIDVLAGVVVPDAEGDGAAVMGLVVGLLIAVAVIVVAVAVAIAGLGSRGAGGQSGGSESKSDDRVAHGFGSCPGVCGGAPLR